MVIRCGAVFGLTFMAGCSLIYDTGKLPVAADADPFAPDGRFDGGLPDGVPPDANVDALAIEGVEPSQIDEGMGSGGGRPVVLVVTARNHSNPTVTVTWTDGAIPDPITVEPIVLSMNGADRIAVPVRLPVMESFDAGEQRMLRITVAQGSVSREALVRVNGLPEILSGSLPATPEPLYSGVHLTAPTRLVDGNAVRVRSTGSIQIDAGAAIDVSASGRNAGPGGCGGGASGSASMCGTSSGLGGAMTTLLIGGGGGGGGYAGVGSAGVGGSGTPPAPAGGGGMAFASTPAAEMLVPLGGTGINSGNRGHGGGGGGAGTILGGSGGIGGGGGGVLELSARGDLVINAAVTAGGGQGTVAGSGGGGGSGGAILARAGGQIVVGSGVKLTAPGGPRTGDPSNPPPVGGGGAGADGRIRIDHPGSTDLSGISQAPLAVGGPAWLVDNPTLSRDRRFDMVLRGQPGRSFSIRLRRGADDIFVRDVVQGGNGLSTVMLDLSFPFEYGVYTLCAIYAPSSASPMLGLAEAESCTDVAWFP